MIHAYNRIIRQGTINEPGGKPDPQFALPSTVTWMRALRISSRPLASILPPPMPSTPARASSSDCGRVGIFAWYYGVANAASAMPIALTRIASGGSCQYCKIVGYRGRKSGTGPCSDHSRDGGIDIPAARNSNSPLRPFDTLALLHLNLLPERDHDFRLALIHADSTVDVHGLTGKIAYVANHSHVACEDDANKGVVRIFATHIYECGGTGASGVNLTYRAFNRDGLADVRSGLLRRNGARTS